MAGIGVVVFGPYSAVIRYLVLSFVFRSDSWYTRDHIKELPFQPHLPLLCGPYYDIHRLNHGIKPTEHMLSAQSSEVSLA